jgi:hypothetical protein
MFRPVWGHAEFRSWFLKYVKVEMYIMCVKHEKYY